MPETARVRFWPSRYSYPLRRSSLRPKICRTAANTEASNRTREYPGYGGRNEVARVVGETQSKKCVTKRPGMRTEMFLSLSACGSYAKFHGEKFVLMQTVPKARQLG